MGTEASGIKLSVCCLRSHRVAGDLSDATGGIGTVFLEMGIEMARVGWQGYQQSENPRKVCCRARGIDLSETGWLILREGESASSAVKLLPTRAERLGLTLGR